MKKVMALYKKEVLSEWRMQHTFYGILLYTASTIFILYISMQEPEAVVWNGLFWITLLFMCVQTVAKSFLQESKGRLLYYQTLVSPFTFLLAKFLYNVSLMLLMCLITLLLFSFFMGIRYVHFGQFIWITCLGGFSLTLLFTLLSAIAAKANQHATLMAILGFPLMIPQLLLVLRLSKAAFGEVYQEGVLIQLNTVLLSLDGLILLLSFILFPFLWKD